MEELSPPQRLLLVNTRERNGSGSAAVIFSQGATVGGLCGGHYSFLSLSVPKKGKGGGGGSLEPWSPESFVVEPRAQSFSRLGTRTKMLFWPKWSPRAPEFSVFEPRSPTFFRPVPWSLKPLWDPVYSTRYKELSRNTNLSIS